MCTEKCEVKAGTPDVAVGPKPRKFFTVCTSFGTHGTKRRLLWGGGSVMTCVQQRQASGFRNTRYINRSLIKVYSQLNILLEKLTVSHVVKKFPFIYVTRRFITAMCAHCCAILIHSTLFVPFPCDVCQYYSPFYA